MTPAVTLLGQNARGTECNSHLVPKEHVHIAGGSSHVKCKWLPRREKLAHLILSFNLRKWCFMMFYGCLAQETRPSRAWWRLMHVSNSVCCCCCRHCCFLPPYATIICSIQVAIPRSKVVRYPWLLLTWYNTRCYIIQILNCSFYIISGSLS